LASIPDTFQTHFLARFNKLPDWERALILSALLRISDLLLATAPVV
jgi:hypothetical protein